MRHILASLILACVFLFHASSLRAQEAVWNSKITALDLPALAKFMDDPTSPRWPVIPYASAEQARINPNYALGLKLFDKIEAAEWADPDFASPNQSTLIQSYVTLSKQLRASGGYANLLLADTCNRLALIRLGRWSMADRNNIAPAAQFLHDLQCPLLDLNRLNTLAAEDPAFSAVRIRTGGPAKNPTTLPAEFSQALQTAFARLTLSHPALLVNQSRRSDSERYFRTRELLNNPTTALLLRRLQETDIDAVIKMPLFLVESRDLELLGKYGPPTLAKLHEIFRATFGTPACVAGFEKLFNATWANPTWDHLSDLKANLRYPGIGGVNQFSDSLYAYAVDPPPRMPFSPPLKFQITTTKLDAQRNLPELPFEVSPSGDLWAFLQVTRRAQTRQPVPRRLIPTDTTTRPTSPATRPDDPYRPRYQPGLPQSTTQPGFASTQPGGAQPTFVPDRTPSVQVVLNGKPGKAYFGVSSFRRPDGTMGYVRFSPTGGHYAYIASAADGEHVVLDGIEGPAFRMVPPESMVFSHNGRTLAYTALREHELFVIVNDKQYGPYYHAHSLTCSADGSRTAWLIQLDNMAQQAFVVVDGKNVAPNKVTNRVVISDDGKRWAYLVQTDTGVMTKIEGQDPTQIDFSGLPIAFSPDGKHLISTSIGDNSLIVDGRAVARFDKPIFQPPTFSPDGKLIRCASETSSAIVDFDGAIISQAPDMAFYNPHGNRMIPYTRGNKLGRLDDDLGFEPMVFNLGGKKLTRPYGMLYGRTFGPDERFYTFTVEAPRDRANVMRNFFSVEGQDFGPYTALQFQTLGFSPDGSLFALATRRGTLWRITINGQETSETFEQFLPVPAFFTGPQSFRMVAIKDGQIQQVNVSLTGKPPATTRPAIDTFAAMKDPNAPSTAAAGSSYKWERKIAVKDCFAGPQMAGQVTGLMLDGQPAFVHSFRANNSEKGRSAALTTRTNGTWKTQILQTPGADDTCEWVDAVVSRNDPYIVIGQMEKLTVLTRANGKWKPDFEASEGGTYPTIATAPDGQPFVVYVIPLPKQSRGGYGWRAGVLQRTAAGKWDKSELQLPHHGGIIHLDAACIADRPSVVVSTPENHGTFFAERVGADWKVETIKQALYAHLLDTGHGPGIFSNSWYTRANVNGKLAASPVLTGEIGTQGYNATVGGSSAAMIGDKPAIAYFDVRSHELHYRELIDGKWTDDVIAFGDTNGTAAITLFASAGKPVVGYFGRISGQDNTVSLILLEATKPAK